MNSSISIARPQTSSSGPKCFSDGRSRRIAASDAVKTASSTVPAAFRSSTDHQQQHRRGRAAEQQHLAAHRQRPQPGPHQHVPGVAEIARQEDDDRDLGELGRLELDRPDLDRQERAVDLVADARQARHHQQRDPHRGDRVAVALEHVVVAQEDDRGAEGDQPDHEPLRLLARQLGVDAVDHHQPERRQRGRQREQVGVGVGQPGADEQVREHAQAEEHQAVGGGGVAHVLGAAHKHRREAGADQQGDRDQAEQLARAGAHRCAPRVQRAALELAHQVLGVGAAAPLVIQQPLAPRPADRSGRDAAGVVLGVQLQPQRQVVGQAAVEGDQPGVVGAHEVHLARRRDPGRHDQPQHDHRGQRREHPAQSGPPARALPPEAR